MAYTLEDALGNVRASRAHFLKHLEDLRNDQLTWKPYPECKSIVETLAHLIADDRAALDSFQHQREPDYESFTETERDPARLRFLLDESFAALCDFITKQYAEAPLDAPSTLYGTTMKLGSAISGLSSEDYYHAGQVAFIRIATDPAWDYYSIIYGG